MEILLSAIVLVKDEEENIIDCLETLKFADEIIIINDNSTDRTNAILTKLKDPKIHIYHWSHGKDFSAMRNYGLEKATGQWVLFIDADERVSDPLTFEITHVINQPNNPNSGYFLKRIDSLWGRQLQHGEAGNIKLLRLAKHGAGKWQGVVHERWVVKGKTETLQNPLFHFPHESIKSFLQKMNTYTTLRAEELFEKKVHVHWFSVILYPKTKFIIDYVIKQGYKDGTAGFVHAMLMSFHSFLVRGKLWQMWDRKR